MKEAVSDRIRGAAAILAMIKVPAEGQRISTLVEQAAGPEGDYAEVAEMMGKTLRMVSETFAPQSPSSTAK